MLPIPLDPPTVPDRLVDLSLAHYSAAPIGQILYSAQHFRPMRKPRGLWLSVDSFKDGWADYLSSAHRFPDLLAYRATVVPAPNSRLLWLKNPQEIADFNTGFGERDGIGSLVRWDRVAEHFQGIIIAPHCWTSRIAVETEWYYSWDCASGCVWDCNAIRVHGSVPNPDQAVEAGRNRGSRSC